MYIHVFLHVYTYRCNKVLRIIARAVAIPPRTSWSSFDLLSLRNPPGWCRHHGGTILTPLCPDGLAQLNDGTEYIVELTAPWEGNFAEAHCREKHQNLLHRWRMTHPNTYLLCAEVGARSLPASSLTVYPPVIESVLDPNNPSLLLAGICFFWGGKNLFCSYVR